MEVYNFDAALIKKLTDTGYQHFTLETSEGKKVVPFNPEKKNSQKKLDEIKKRLTMLPDGLYQLKANWNYGGSGSPDTFLIKKGNAPIDTAQPIQQVVQLRENNRTVENVLSYEVALQNIQTIAQLEAQVRELTKENTRLNLELEEIEKAENEAPLSEGGLSSSVTSWLKEITPILLPLADRYFDTENRKLQVKERDQYFQYGQKKKAQIVNGHVPRTRRTSPEQHTETNYPNLENAEEVNNFFDALEKLEDAQFEEACKTISEEHPELYKLVLVEFEEQEEGTTLDQ
jgi:hypothetical protein